MARLALVAIGGLWVALASCASRPDVPGDQAETSNQIVDKSHGEPSAEGSTEFSFTVVDGRSGKPIANADVLWEQDPTNGKDDFLGVNWLFAWSAKMEPDLDDLESRLTSLGNRIRSDANGRVTLPGSEFPSVFCREGKLLGGTESLHCDESDVCRLHLWPDGDIRVRVVDAAGRPLADTGVMLVGTFTAGHSSYAELRATTRSDGLAVFRHGFPFLASCQLDSDPRTWRIDVESLPAGVGSFELDPKALPREPVTIRMPPSAAVEVEVHEPDGSPCTLDLPIGLMEVDAETLEWVKRPDTGVFRTQDKNELWTNAVGGKARFAQIAPRLELFGYAARNEASRVNIIRFDGPTRIGETVKASIVLGADSVILTGCAKSPSGDPLANQRVRISLYGAPSPERDPIYNLFEREASRGPSGKLMTDASGRFTLEYSLDAADHGRPVLLIEHRRSDGIMLAKRVELQDVWKVDRHDLGDILLGEIPIMAAGVVVDESDAPIPGVWLYVKRGGWHSGHDFETNERGEFEWRSAIPDDRVALEVHKDGYFDPSDRDEAEFGRTDWRIVLQKASSIVGRVLLPVGADHRDYSYSVWRQDETAGGRFRSGGGDVAPDGTFSWEDCEQGTYSLTLRSVRENDFSPFQLDGLEVRKGQTVDLGVIDLRGAFRPVKLRVVAPDGSLVAGSFAYGPHGSDLLEQLRTTLWPREFSEGWVIIPRNGEEELDIALVAPGLKTKVFRELRDGEVLRMESGLQVQITLAKGASKPPEGQRLLLGLFSPDADPRAIVLKGPRWPTEAFDSKEGVTLLAPAPGTYRLRWILERGSDMQLESRYWQEPPQAIELTDTSELQRFEVVCPIDPATAWKNE